MVTGDLLRLLFRSYANGDDTGFRHAAETIIADERAKNHRLLADDLERVLIHGNSRAPSGTHSSPPRDIPRDRERGFALVDVCEPTVDWDRLVVSNNTASALLQVAEEHRKSILLASAGLQPTQRLLFYGPPGCGKTLAAQVLASALSYRLVTVRFDAVISSYLGETAANLRRVFDFIEKDRWVVLFDEFDAIGKDRDNPIEHGELKRVVNSLLQLMDAFRGQSILIAATNHETLLDTAVWRRFESVVHFPPPTQQERVLLLKAFLRGFSKESMSFVPIAKQIAGATGADIERIAIDAARRATMANRSTIVQDDLRPGIEGLKIRLDLQKKLSEGSRQPINNHRRKS